MDRLVKLAEVAPDQVVVAARDGGLIDRLLRRRLGMSNDLAAALRALRIAFDHFVTEPAGDDVFRRFVAPDVDRLGFTKDWRLGGCCLGLLLLTGSRRRAEFAQPLLGEALLLLLA